MHLMTGWQEKSMRVRTLYAGANDFKDRMLIPPPKTNHETIVVKVRYFDVANQGFPDRRKLATLVTLQPG